MVYSDIKKFGLHNILPQKQRYGSERDKRLARTAILQNSEFTEFALKDTDSQSMDSIIDKMIKFVIACNDCYYNYELKYYDENGKFNPQGVGSKKEIEVE